MNAAIRTIGLFLLTCLPAGAALAQTEDPAKRALEKIEAAVDGRAAAAGRALDAARLVGESADAKKQGNTAEALAAHDGPVLAYDWDADVGRLMLDLLPVEEDHGDGP